MTLATAHDRRCGLCHVVRSALRLQKKMPRPKGEAGAVGRDCTDKFGVGYLSGVDGNGCCTTAC
jgi:hypothetical protein